MGSKVALGLGILGSAGLLVALLVMQVCRPDVLKVDTGWLAIVVLPILVSLLVGGYIRSFKAFGVELESALSGKVSALDLGQAAQVPIEAGGAVGKQGSDDLDRLRREHAQRCPERLVLRKRRNVRYVQDLIRLYLEAFPSVRFLEVQHEDATFEALLPVEALGNRGQWSDEAMMAFEGWLNSREAGPLDSREPGPLHQQLITWSLSDTASVTDAIRVHLERGANYLPVVSCTRRLTGVVSINRVTDDLLRRLVSMQERKDVVRM